jgi:two-component system phosphate regulon sensor histidine kinase PhoR
MIESARWTQVLNTSLNGIYIHDVKLGQNIFINSRYTALTGYTSDDLNKMEKAQFFELFHPDDRQRVAEHMEKLVGGSDDMLEIEYRFKTKDGRWIRCLSNDCVFARDEDDTISQFIGTFLDITDRKQAEEALPEAKQELEIKIGERTAELQQAIKQLQAENQERIRTEQSLRLERARLDALLHLSRISEASLQEISSFTLEQAIALTHSKIGFVGLLNEDESVYSLNAVSKDVVKECAVPGDPMQWHVVDAGIWADAIRERRTLFVNDYSQPHPQKKGLPPGHPYVQRFMVVPILEGEKTVAVAGVGNKDSDYDNSDERQIALLLSGMWGYVQRNRSREELRQA